MAGNTQPLHHPLDATSVESGPDLSIGRHELERKLAERTEELAAARREIDAFTYSVAHDLRAPLRLIHAHVQMLREYVDVAASREPQIHLDQIQRGAKHLSALIDGILTLSRLGQVELRCEHVSLQHVATEAMHAVQAAGAGRDIGWRIEPLPAVRCDRQLMLQALAALLGNAVKYSAPRLRASIRVGVADDGERHIFVRDNGVGFDMRYAGKLFGAFQRLHRQDEFEGVGIGLAVAKRIVERHGGRIWADARVGEGATFRFSLPGMS
jgi:light-regulated signal transduction histidine kinase (bacteriophytochrome)